MTSLLSRGLLAVEHALGGDPGERADGAGRALERVEVDRSGRLVFTVDAAAGTRWFAFEESGLSELHPGMDEALPFARANNRGVDRGVDNIVSWRPGRRICVQAPSSFWKAYRKGRSNKPVRNHRLVASSLTHQDSFRVPRVLDVDEATHALELSRVHGEPLTIATTDAGVFQRIGVALRDFQRSVPIGDLDEHTPSDELLVLEQLSTRVAKCVELPTGWKSGLARLADVRPRARALVAVHRDLHDGQLSRDDDGVGLIDFDLLAKGSPLLDAANLTAHLRLRALQNLHEATHESADACARALLDGLNAEPDFDDLAALRFYQSTTFLRLALVYAIRPRWSDRTPVLVQLAQRCADEIVAV